MTAEFFTGFGPLFLAYMNYLWWSLMMTMAPPYALAAVVLFFVIHGIRTWWRWRVASEKKD